MDVPTLHVQGFMRDGQLLEKQEIDKMLDILSTSYQGMR